MSDFPSTLSRPQKLTIAPWAASQPFGDSMLGQRLTPPTTAGTWPVANRAIFMPIIIERPMTIYQLAAFNGVVAGNVDCGLYSYPGSGLSATRMASAGTTAMSGTETVQVFDITDQNITAGIYFLAFVCSTITTATFRRSTPALPAAQIGGVLQQNLAETKLPETATLSRPESSYVPAVLAIGRELL